MDQEAGERIIKPSFIRKDERGTFVEILNEGPWETVTHGSMAKEAVMGNHYHERTVAFFYLTRGSAEIVLRNVAGGTEQRFRLKAGGGIYFYPYETHAIRYLESSDFIFLKSRRFSKADPDLISTPLT